MGRALNPISGLPLARVEGVVTSGISMIHANTAPVIVDAANYGVGWANFSFIQPNAKPLRIRIPRMRGFECYIRGAYAGKTYRLVFLNDGKSSASVFADITQYRLLSNPHAWPAIAH